MARKSVLPGFRGVPARAAARFFLRSSTSRFCSSVRIIAILGLNSVWIACNALRLGVRELQLLLSEDREVIARRDFAQIGIVPAR